ncbi:hypothetical protein B0H65DRAFT_547260 [Neurospora tetraspora]|uniref:Uncharacterized protein n=1 Tax=Neurospora tetraspora TaxID=94610 RepID=A0AAE0JH64_9PEZI|nr:hypothetical protein B0H65DRAFT_547260 [Neurospora tetraspora]
MLARRGVIADQLSDSQVQGDTPQSAERRPEPQTTIEPSGTLTPSGSESASATSSSPHDNKAAPRQAQGKHHNHHNHHQWDNLPGITSEAEVLRQMREQGQEQQQSGNNRRPKHEATLEGQVGSTSRQGETTGKKQREISRGREGSAGESHAANVGSWSHSRERRRSSSASSSVGAGAGAGGGGGGATKGYDPNDYDRGAYVETSRVGLE